MNPFKKSHLLLIALLFVPLTKAFGSTGELDKVKAESLCLRSFGLSESSWGQYGKGLPEPLSQFKTALRDWIESELPSNRSGLDSGVSFFKSRMAEELLQANLWNIEEVQSPFGYVTNLEIFRPEVFPEALVITMGVSVPCGHDDSVYAYRFDGLTWQRVVESNDSGSHGTEISKISFSTLDSDGRRLMFIGRYGVQCASMWNMLSYKIFRLDRDPEPALEIFTDSHSFYGYEYNIKLEPDQFLIELTDRSVDGGIHSRTHILNYRFDVDGAHRVEPFALQAQDFVEEWLTRPWDEIQKTCTIDDMKKFEQWHQVLHSEHVFGDYNFVQPCASKSGQTQISMDLDSLEGKELPEPLTVYFVVQEETNYRFKMLNISFKRQAGCPGESFPRNDYPSLFKPIKQDSSDVNGLPPKPPR